MSQDTIGTVVIVLRFLRDYKSLECHCCNEVLGFANRQTGQVYCVKQACLHGQGHGPQAITRESAPEPLPQSDMADGAAIKMSIDTASAAGAQSLERSQENALEKGQHGQPLAIADRGDSPPQPFLYKMCKFSTNLFDGAAVKVAFSYNLDKMQITADADGKQLELLEEKIIDMFDNGKEVLIDRPPVLNEVVFAEYGGSYFRARVVKIEGEKYRLMFLDYGDYKDTDIHADKLYELDEETKKLPLLSVCVTLDGVMKLRKKINPPKKLFDLFYENLTLAFVNAEDRKELEVSSAESYKAVLFLTGREGESLNLMVAQFLGQTAEQAGG